MQHRTVYAIYDNAAQDFIGGQHALIVCSAQAVAERIFTDLATDKNTIVNKHLPEYDLVSLGIILDGTITPESSTGLPERRVILSGQQLHNILSKEQ